MFQRFFLMCLTFSTFVHISLYMFPSNQQMRVRNLSRVSDDEASQQNTVIPRERDVIWGA